MDRPVPMCMSCIRSGPHIDRVSIRWLLRGAGAPRSRLSYDEVVKLFEAQAIADNVECAREGASWYPFYEHPDFRGLFYPGAPSDILRQELLQRRAALERKKTRKRRNRVIGSAFLAFGSVLFAFISSNSNFLVLPEHYQTMLRERIYGPEEEGLSTAGNEKNLPMVNVPDLPARASINESLPSLLYHGQRGLLRGTTSGLIEATSAYEQAVALAPSDVDALAGLAEAYTRQLSILPERLKSVTSLLYRAMELEPNAISVIRARAFMQVSDERLEDAVELLSSCGEPIEEVMTAKVDFGCAVSLAELRQDTDTLMLLREQYPDILAVDLSLARVVRATQDRGVASELDGYMTVKYPEEPLGWYIQLMIAASLGDWQQVLTAGENLRVLNPSDLEGISTYAKVMLRFLDNPGTALEIFDEVIAHPHFTFYPQRHHVYLHAAESCIAMQKWPEAEAYTLQAIEEQDTSAAQLMLAYAQLKQGMTEDALETVNGLDIRTVDQQKRSLLYLGVARVSLLLSDRRGVDTALEKSIQTNRTFLDAHLERATAKFLNDDIFGMVDALENASHSDVNLSMQQQSLERPWIPPSSFWEFAPRMSSRLQNEARLVRQEKEVTALIASLSRSGNAVELLESAVELEGVIAPAMLAQVYVGQGRCEQARPMIEKALSARPDSIVMLAMLGHCIGQQNIERGIRALNKALNQDKVSTSVLFWMARTYEDTGDIPEARAYWQNYLKVAQGDILGQRALHRLKGD